MDVGAKEAARLLRDRSRRAREAREREATRLLEALTKGLQSPAWLGPHVRVWLIGSLAWGGFGPHSDVDLVVADASSEEMTELESRVSSWAGRAVDPLRLEDLSEAFAKRVESEGILLHGP